ncbi:MAG: hypothetical protein JW729_09240 [Bacteroidales bacterium]|nr:hypothetical protein [Bacteroidales bacterium]
MFKRPKIGKTLMCIKIDSSSDSASLGYWEIERLFKTEKMSIGDHVRYKIGFKWIF